MVTIINLFISASIVAGIGMLWRRLFKDSARLQSVSQKNLPSLVFGALECPFCFTFWTALAVSLMLNPLSGWIFPLRFTSPSWLVMIVQLFFSWMALGTAAILVRTLTEQFFRFSAQLLCILKNYPLHKHGHKSE
jgi:hypothetical protein